MIRQSFLLLFLLRFPYSEVFGQPKVPVQIEYDLKQGVLKNIEQKGFACNNCEVMIIYWLEYPKNFLTQETLKKLDREFIDSLDLALEPKSKKDIRKKQKSLLYAAVAYNSLTYEAEYFQSERFEDIYVASTFDQLLIQTAERFKIKKMFYMQNVINSDSPYLLLDSANRLFVLVFFIDADHKFDSFSNRIKYKVVPVEKYTKEFTIGGMKIIKIK